MSNQGEQQFSTRPNSLGGVLRFLGVLAATVIAIALVAGTWDDTGAATGEIPMRVFLVGWTVAVIIISAGFALSSPLSRSVVPMVVQHVTVGIVIGLAVGTTDWTTLRLAGWWQLWWTVPLLLVYASLLITRRRFARTLP